MMRAALSNCLFALSGIFFVAVSAFAAGDAEDRELTKWVSERPKLLKRFDGNHNGKIDRAELDAARPVWKKKMTEKGEPAAAGKKGSGKSAPDGKKKGKGKAKK